MGLKVIIVGALLGLIATSGHAFALEHQIHDGLSTGARIINVRKANTIRLSQPAPPKPATPSFPG